MIEIFNTKIVVHGYKRGDCSKLEKVLSVWNSVTYSVSYESFLYDEVNETLTLPAGMSLDWISYLFPKKKLKYVKESDKHNSLFAKMKFDPREQIQKDAIKHITSDGEQKMVCMKTGDGKTYSTINAVIKMRMKALIIVDELDIAELWKSEILKFTNIHESEIYFIKGYKTIDKIMRDDLNPKYKIFIAQHRTLSSYGKDGHWDKLEAFIKKLHIGVKVYDEAHVEWKNIFMVDCYSNTKKTIYLTATPNRSNHTEDTVYQNMFNDLEKFALETKFEGLYHYVYYILFNSKPDKKEIASTKGRHGFDSNAWAEYLFQKPENYKVVYKIIRYFINKFYKKKGKVAIILHRNADVEKLYNSLIKKYGEDQVGIFTSLKTPKQRIEEVKKKIIISTDKSMGKAKNIDNLRFIINTHSFGSKTVAEQMLGRLRYNEKFKSIFIDLCDEGFRSCIEQRKRRQQLLNKKAVVSKKIKWSDILESIKEKKRKKAK